MPIPTRRTPTHRSKCCCRMRTSGWRRSRLSCGGFPSGILRAPSARFWLALIDPQGSEALLHAAIRGAPGFWPAYFELHKLLKAQERWDEAGAALEKTVELNPDYAPAHYALAEYYNRKGDRARAAQEREKHHMLLAEQRRAEEHHRAQAPRLAYTVEAR